MMKNEMISEPATTTAAASLTADQSTKTISSSVRVWLVDDDKELRKLLAQVLDLQSGIQCARHFSSPDELLSILASKPGPDVVLMDVQMGDRNGLDAVRPIRSLTRWTRVLMFTTCYNQEWRERALGDGASDYVLKSETIEGLADRIRRAAEDPAPVPCRKRSNCPALTTTAPNRARPEKTPRIFDRAWEKLCSLWN
ncbi:MAG TPA: response regulator transcription factor [Candidatus Saccharimonadales bacterium]|nr:response regulator transcription factor [Candidatus Saccharimonadales bacterium]